MDPSYRILIVDLFDRCRASAVPAAGEPSSLRGSYATLLANCGPWDLVCESSLAAAHASAEAAAATGDPFALVILLADGQSHDTNWLEVERLLIHLPGVRLLSIWRGADPPPAAIGDRRRVSLVRDPVSPDVLIALVRAACDAWVAERGPGGGDGALWRAQRAAGIGYWTLSATTGCAEWDAGVRAVLGLEPEQPAGLELLKELVHPDDWPGLYASLSRTLADGTQHSYRYRIRRPDGEERWIACWGEAQRGRGGAVERVVGLAQDVTEQHIAESALRESEERFRLFMDNAPGGAYIKDDENRLLYANAWYVAQSGRRAEEILNQPMDAFLPKEVAEALWRQDRLVLAEGRRMIFEQELMRPEGLRHYLITKHPWSLRDGRTLIFGMAVDITEQREQLERLTLMQYALDQVADGAFLVDVEGRLRYVNQGACRSLGYERDELLNMPISEIDPYLPSERWTQLWETQGDNRRETFETLYLRRDGGLMPVEVSANYVAHRDGAFVLALARDVSERWAAEEKLRQSDAAFESSADGILVTDARMRILSVNAAFCEISGYRSDEVLGQTPDVLGAGHRQDMVSSAEMWQLAQRGDRSRGEVWNRRKDGGLYLAQLTVSAIRDRNGVVRNYVGVFSDITGAKRSQDELERLAHHDFLTELPNRLLFNARLIHALERARREGWHVSVLFLDLDRFKEVNDTYGHLAGDDVLRQVAVRLSHVLRAGDTLARLGGDELAAILERVSTDEERAMIANKLVRALREPFTIAGEPVRIGLSVGIAHYPQDAADATTLIQHADRAMYVAKANGGDGFSFYRPHDA